MVDVGSAPQATAVDRWDTKGRGLLLALVLYGLGSPIFGAVWYAVFPSGWDLFDNFEGRVLLTIMAQGWTQLPYMVPAAIVLHVRGKRQARNGLLLTAGLVFLLTCGCWGLLLV